MDDKNLEALGKYLAELITPHLSPETHPLEWYTRENIGLQNADAFAKTNEALVAFERALMETKWDIEKDLVCIAHYEKSLAEANEQLEAAEDEPTKEKLKLSVKTLMTYLAKNKGNLADHQDKYVQQKAFVSLLRNRLLSASENLLGFEFNNTDEITKE